MISRLKFVLYIYYKLCSKTFLDVHKNLDRGSVIAFDCVINYLLLANVYTLANNK